MRVHFLYTRDKDVWCLLNKGKSSNNSSKSTKVYDQLVSVAGDTPTQVDAENFVDAYIKNNGIDVDEYGEKYRQEWEAIEQRYHARAEEIFGVVLPQDINAYLTINSRCPYNVLENFFYVSVPSDSVRGTIMHELWHFYTWYCFGEREQERLGKEHYNELKEALTVLINAECSDLLPEGQMDKGYVQHSELRAKILEMWKEKRDVRYVWETLSAAWL